MLCTALHSFLPSCSRRECGSSRRGRGANLYFLRNSRFPDDDVPVECFGFRLLPTSKANYLVRIIGGAADAYED